MEDRMLQIALNASNVTRAALCRLAQTTDTWRRASAAEAPAVASRIGVPLVQLRRAFDVAARAEEIAGRELERAERRGCRVLTLPDPDYPAPLHDLALPPPVVYCRGEIGGPPALAIVGSRKMDDYGKAATEAFASRLAAAGVAIVSGFARGIDATAHRAALSVPRGRTVAVLGCGLDVDYPRGQSRLAAAIAERGALVSEYPFGSSPRPWHFPIRNRVIAALAWATLVVQATRKSGSLITVHHALEIGRDVYAVPGRIFDELSAGTNHLLADGALVARSIEDLLEGGERRGLPLKGQGRLFAPAAEAAAREPDGGAAPPREPAPEGTPGRVLEALPPGDGQTAEDVAGRLELPVDQVLGALLELELGGWIRRQPGPVYVR